MKPWDMDEDDFHRIAMEPGVDADTREEVMRSVEVIQVALSDPILELMPLGKPKVVVTCLHWAAGQNAMVAIPADDPSIVCLALWSSLSKMLEAHGVPLQDFLDMAMKEDEDASDG